MQPPRRANQVLRPILVSLVVHTVFFVSVVVFGTQATIRIVKPMPPQRVAQLTIAGGSHAIRITLPASAFAAHTREPVPNADSAKKTIVPLPTPPLEKSGGGAPRTPHHGDGSGKAFTGNGSDAADMRPAFPVFSPHPPLSDRSLLPSTATKVVVDVELDAQGNVVSEKLVQGLGTRLDQIVLETVKTWRFQPATVNGKPVPAEAEVVFPFTLDYPIKGSDS